MEIGLDRMKTFGRRRLAVGVTTCTFVGNPGWRRLLTGSHERLLVDCLQCGAAQELNWDFLRIMDPAAGATALSLADAVKAGIDPERVMISGTRGQDGLARWACAYCGRLHTARERDNLVLDACRANRWVPGKWVLDESHPSGSWSPWAKFDDGHRFMSKPPCETTIRTGHIHSLYSSFVTLCECAAREMRLLDLGGGEEEWTAHRNNWRCEPTIPDRSGDAEPAAIATSTAGGNPRGTAPAGADRILITCDQQGNSLDDANFPFVVRGYKEGESWLIETGTVYGFDEVEELEKSLWTVGMNRVACKAIAMDAANGNMRQYVQTWAQAKANRRFLLHGRDNIATSVQRRYASVHKRPGRSELMTGVHYYYTNVDTWKTMLWDRIRSIGPGWHAFVNPPAEYISSLGSEHRIIVKDRRGRTSERWVPRELVTKSGRTEERTDTHWWDCEHMQLAGAHILQWDVKPKSQPTSTRYGVVGKVEA
jgi:hypothetical protein